VKVYIGFAPSNSKRVHVVRVLCTSFHERELGEKACFIQRVLAVCLRVHEEVRWVRGGSACFGLESLLLF
jgi:hypothetical protein